MVVAVGRSLLLGLVVCGCAAQAEQADRFVGEGLDVLENTSRVAVNTCRQYLGTTARVGPLLEWINTDERRAAYQVLFSADALTLP